MTQPIFNALLGLIGAAVGGGISWMLAKSRFDGMVAADMAHQKEAVAALHKRNDDEEKMIQALEHQLDDMREELVSKGALQPRTNPGY